MPNALSKFRLPHPVRQYYYGQHNWENYLIDIQETIAELKFDTSPDFNPGFDMLSGTLDNLSSGIEELGETLDDLVTGVEELGAKFEWGFTLMIDCQERQIKILDEIVNHLSAIREAVQLPSTTRAKELFILGQRDFQRGLLPEALQKFLAAERENQVNFPLQLQIGKLLLYGKSRTSSVCRFALCWLRTKMAKIPRHRSFPRRDCSLSHWRTGEFSRAHGLYAEMLRTGADQYWVRYSDMVRILRTLLSRREVSRTSQTERKSPRQSRDYRETRPSWLFRKGRSGYGFFLYPQ